MPQVLRPLFLQVELSIGSIQAVPDQQVLPVPQPVQLPSGAWKLVELTSPQRPLSEMRHFVVPKGLVQLVPFQQEPLPHETQLSEASLHKDMLVATHALETLRHKDAGTDDAQLFAAPP